MFSDDEPRPYRPTAAESRKTQGETLTVQSVQHMNRSIDQLKKTNELLRQVIQQQLEEAQAMKKKFRRWLVISAMYAAFLAVAILFDLTLFTW